MNQKKKYKPRPKEQKRISDRKYYLKHRDKILAQTRTYRDNHKDQLKEYSINYREEHREKLLEDKKKYYREHSEIFKNRSKKWVQDNMERAKETKRTYHKENANRLRDYHRKLNLKKKYGITEEEYQFILEEQGGVCALCNKPSKTRRLSVDHEHQPKENNKSSESKRARIRGLLCHRCNRALGLFGNNLDMLLLISVNFAEYIKKYYAKRITSQSRIEEAPKKKGKK